MLQYLFKSEFLRPFSEFPTLVWQINAMFVVEMICDEKPTFSPHRQMRKTELINSHTAYEISVKGTP